MIEGKEVLGHVEGGGERRIGVGEEEEIKLPHRHIGPHRNLHFIPFPKVSSTIGIQGLIKALQIQNLKSQRCGGLQGEVGGFVEVVWADFHLNSNSSS